MILDYSHKQSQKSIIDSADKLINNKPPITVTPPGILIKGDNFQIMANLLATYRNAIDLVYIDPPYNTNASYFCGEERTAHISHASNDILAYSDKFEFEEYLDFLRMRLILIRELLNYSGSLYIHIGLDCSHYIKILLDEIFGRVNFVNEITRVKSNPKNFSRSAFGNQKDIIFIYSKTPKKNIFNEFREPLTQGELAGCFNKTDASGLAYTTVPCHAPGETKTGATGEPWRGILPPKGRHWRCAPEVLEKLDKDGMIEWSKNGVPRIKKYAKDHKGKKLQDVWLNYKDPQYPLYPTEKNMEMLEMIIQQSSRPGSLIMDCFCGSGAFLAAGIQQGRQVIGVDSSASAIKVAAGRPELAGVNLVEF